MNDVPNDSFYEPPEPPKPPKGMTCGWCKICEIAPDRNSDYCFCTICNEWVLLEGNVRDLGCEAWELRSDYE